MKYLYLFLCLILISACKREVLNTSDIISNLQISNHKLNADGTTYVLITATLNNMADSNKRSIIFTSSAGIFAVAKDTVITQKASPVNGALIAQVKLQMPATACEIYITARPASASLYQDFTLKDSIDAVKVAPDKITLTPSSLSVHTAFLGEVNLSGLLSFQNKNVSTGNKVIFEDYFANGQSVNGRFRAVRDTTDITSTVIATYSPGALAAGTNVFIRCTYLNDSGAKTAIKDSCEIAVIP